MSQPTITGELRKWHHDVAKNGDKVVIGLMYNDTNDIWEDGEPAVIRYSQLVESPNFYLAVVLNHTCIKCPKDEEIRDARKTHNGGSGDVG